MSTPQRYRVALTHAGGPGTSVAVGVTAERTGAEAVGQGPAAGDAA